MHRARRSAPGFALIEALVALTILSVAGLAFVDLTAESAQNTIRTRSLEDQIADEDRLLAAYALLDHTDLEQRIGTRTVGRYRVQVERMDWNLYRVAVGPERSDPDLVTVIYRVAPPDET